MNQILVTKKLYVTPELKRRKKLYKVCFLLSVIMVIVLMSFYIYAEYDKYKNEEIAQQIIDDVNIQIMGSTSEEDTTTISEFENALVIEIERSEAIKQIVDQNVANNGLIAEEDKKQIISGQYVANNGNTYKIMGMINIPEYSIKYPIISETTDELMKISVCKFWGPDSVNTVGNLCIIGHNYKNTKFFSKLVDASCGDLVQITDLSGKTIDYEIYDIYTIDPSDTKCTSQKTHGKKEVTLITCTNDGKMRIVIKCKEKVQNLI